MNLSPEAKGLSGENEGGEGSKNQESEAPSPYQPQLKGGKGRTGVNGGEDGRHARVKVASGLRERVGRGSFWQRSGGCRASFVQGRATKLGHPQGG